MSLPSPHSNQWAVITGASSGIGECLARQLGAKGYPLILVARRQGRLDALARDITHDYGVPVQTRALDLGDHQARAVFCQELAESTVAILCNNAGFATFGNIQNLNPQRERQQVELNVLAVHDLTQAVLPGMLERGQGVIQITGSTAGHQPMPGSATYSASKAFANTFCEALHQELKGSGVSCTLLAPGPVRTGFAEVAGISAVEGAGGNSIWLSADRVASETLAAMDKGHRRVVPGLFAKLETMGGRYTPRALLLPIVSQVLKRVS